MTRCSVNISYLLSLSWFISEFIVEDSAHHCSGWMAANTGKSNVNQTTMELEVPASPAFPSVLTAFTSGLDSQELFWTSEFPDNRREIHLLIIQKSVKIDWVKHYRKKSDIGKRNRSGVWEKHASLNRDLTSHQQINYKSLKNKDDPTCENPFTKNFILISLILREYGHVKHLLDILFQIFQS